MMLELWKTHWVLLTRFPQTVDQPGIASEQDGFMGAENEGDDYETIYTLQRSKKGMIIIVLVVVNE